jgi:hypothetical protein
MPYLNERHYLKNWHRVEEWLERNGGTLPMCTIDFGHPEVERECNHIKAMCFGYSSLFKSASIDWNDGAVFRQATAAILDLSLVSDFDSYARLVSKKSKGNVNRAVRKALRLGYKTRLINVDDYCGSIALIRRSQWFRTGGLMWELVLPRVIPADRGETDFRTPHCHEHWSQGWGVFKGEKVAAYALLLRCGNVVRVGHVMGHREALADGGVKLLHFDIVRTFLNSDSKLFSGIQYYHYGAWEHGHEGLTEWKSRLLFRPHLIQMGTKFDELPPGFDGKVYLALNPDVRKVRADPRMHYTFYGKLEGRRYR